MTVALAEVDTDRVLPLDRNKRVAKQALVLEEHKRRHWWIDAASGVTKDDVRHHEFWAHIAPQLRRHDLITVVDFEQSWEMLVCVEKVAQTGADVSVRKVAPRTPIQSAVERVDDAGEYVAEWRGGESWCVVRVRDGIPMVKNHSQKAAAIAEWRGRQPRKVA